MIFLTLGAHRERIRRCRAGAFEAPREPPCEERWGDPEVLQEGSEDSCRLGRDPERSSEHASTLEGRLGRQRAGNEVLRAPESKVSLFLGI